MREQTTEPWSRFQGSVVAGVLGPAWTYWQGVTSMTEGIAGATQVGGVTVAGVSIACEPSVLAQQPVWPETI